MSGYVRVSVSGSPALGVRCPTCQKFYFRGEAYPCGYSMACEHCRGRVEFPPWPPEEEVPWLDALVEAR